MKHRIVILTIVFIFITLFKSYAQIVINEFMAEPVNGEPEWIELYNPTNTDFNEKFCFVCDDGSSKTISSINIPAMGYAVLVKDTNKLKAFRNIPFRTLLIQFPIPSLNNAGDIIEIRHADSSLIDSAYYIESWGRRGISYERRDWAAPGCTKDNLSPSQSPDSATCGYRNSTAIPDYDVAISSIIFNSVSKTIDVTLSNLGRYDLTNVSMNLFIDKNNDNIASSSELFSTKDIPLIKAKDNEIISIPEDSAYQFVGNGGWYDFISVCSADKNDVKNNDSLVSNIFVSGTFSNVAINEFMYDPADGSGEFVELYNNSADSISLYNWSISTKPKTTTYKIKIDKNYITIPPFGYGVVTWDSSFFNYFPELIGQTNVFFKQAAMNLSINGDDIYLLDPNSKIIDSLSYLPSWHEPGLNITKNISLEKLNPALTSNNAGSWSSCMDFRGATPGKINSIARPVPTKGSLTATPNPFSIYSTTKEHLCLVNYKIPYNQARITATIYDTEGLIVRRILNSNPSQSESSFVWDGTNDAGFNLAVGPYILLLEAVDLATQNVYQDKLMLVIGK